MRKIFEIFRWQALILIVMITFFVLFRSQIEDFITRSNRANIQYKGISLTLEDSVKSQVEKLNDLRSDIKSILDTAAISKERAVTLSWNLIERKLRRIFAVSHWNKGVYVDPRTNIDILIKLGVLAPNLMSSLKVVEDEHNRISSHQKEGEKEVTELALKSAIQLLGNLYALSLSENIVEITNIKLYSDPECKNEVVGVTGVMIKEILVDGLEPNVSVFPTTRTDYYKGEHVTWDWNESRSWRALWYRDPKTNKIHKFSSVEFIGSDVNAI